MDNGLVVGALIAWSVTYLLVGAYFVAVYAARRADVDYLVFGLLTLSLAVHAVGLGVHYHHPTPHTWAGAHLVAHTGAICAVALGVHFGLLVRGVRLLRPIVAGVYGVSAILLVTLWAGAWFEVARAQVEVVGLFGLRVAVVRAPPTLPVLLFYVLAVVGVFGMTGLLASAWVRGRREVAGALLASLVLCATAAVDVLATLRAARWADLTTHAYVVFALGVASTLVGRYRLATRELEKRSAELERRTAELLASFEQLEAVRDELVRKRQLAALGEMAAVVAHEVRNPIAIIQNALNGVRRAGVTDADRETLYRILAEETLRLNAIVGDLLTYVRPLTVAREPVDLCDLATQAASAIDKGEGVAIEVRPNGATRASADRVLLRQAIENVLQNAVQSMPKGGKVTVASEARAADDGPGQAVLRITDTGEGMPPAVAARATDPFFTTRPAGTGLGLAIVARIVEAHGGALEIETKEREGTTVRLVLPAAEAA
jgi:signal transduction histidine kinase